MGRVVPVGYVTVIYLLVYNTRPVCPHVMYPPNFSEVFMKMKYNIELKGLEVELIP